MTYGLGIYLLNLFIGLLQPQDEMESNDGPRLPMHGGEDEEFRPFVRRVPEFKFWCVLIFDRIFAYDVMKWTGGRR